MEAREAPRTPLDDMIWGCDLDDLNKEGRLVGCVFQILGVYDHKIVASGKCYIESCKYTGDLIKSVVIKIIEDGRRHELNRLEYYSHMTKFDRSNAWALRYCS